LCHKDIGIAAGYLTGEMGQIPDRILQAAAEIEKMDRSMRKVMGHAGPFQARTAHMLENRRRQNRELELLMAP